MNNNKMLQSQYLKDLYKSEISGVVILYNSQDEVISNIQTYLYQIDHLFVVDNSEIFNGDLVRKINSLEHTTYIFNGKNEGIASALNKAANLSVKAGYRYLLTMDDDTAMPEEGIQNMFVKVGIDDIEKYGIIGGQFDSRRVSNSTTLVDYTITSGNLLNLAAYTDCGPFMDSFFIDFVDIEYCFRLSKKGYKVVEVNSVELIHRLGIRKETSFFFNLLKKGWASHSPERVYYKVRNCIYVIRKHGNISLHLKVHFFRDFLMEVIHAVIFEDKKVKRIKLLLEAIRDGLTGNLGRIRQN